MIYLLHAWGEDEDSLRSVGEKLGEPFECLQGSRRVPEGGFAWTSWESNSSGEIARARRRVEEKITRGSALFGFSQGAMLALEVAFAGRVPPRVVVAVGAFLAPGGLARARAHIHRGPPLLLLHGKDDDAVPSSEAEKVLARLRPVSPRTSLVLLPGGHEVTPRMVAMARTFLRARR